MTIFGMLIISGLLLIAAGIFGSAGAWLPCVLFGLCAILAGMRLCVLLRELFNHEENRDV